MLRIQCGLSTTAYYLSQFIVDFCLYAVLTLPSFVMVIIGYRHEQLNYVSQSWLVGIEFLSKFSFGVVLLPLVYLIGFIFRMYQQNLYKSLSLILYVLGHFVNMLILSIV